MKNKLDWLVQTKKEFHICSLVLLTVIHYGLGIISLDKCDSSWTETLWSLSVQLMKMNVLPMKMIRLLWFGYCTVKRIQRTANQWLSLHSWLGRTASMVCSKLELFASS